MSTVIIRQDSYALRRPLFTFLLVDENGDPFDLSGCTVRTTWKTAITDLDTDPTDSTAVVKAVLVVDSTGAATTQTGLYLVGDATAGTIEHRLTSADTAALPLDQTWISDVEVIDSNGERFTFLFEDSDDQISARDAVTHREVD